MACKPLSLRAYAAHRKGLGLPGGSLQAVQRALAGDRIRDAVIVVNGVKRIADPEAADREWAANTDLSKAPGWVKALGGRSTAPAVARGFGGDEDEGDDGGSSLASASAREKHWKAELAELTYKERAGELVNAAEMSALLGDALKALRDELEAIPDKADQQLRLSLEDSAALEEIIRTQLQLAFDKLTALATSRLGEDEAA